MKGFAKKAVKYAEDAGFRYERANAKNVLVYRDGLGHEVSILPHSTEANYRFIVQQVDKARGIGPDLTQKRNVEQIKARRERERTLLCEEKRRHRERIDALLREKQQVALGGLGCNLTERQIKDIERLIEDEVRHHREVVQQMTARPAGVR